jgi:sulfoxide reductase heme-binding subunit YedZ
VPATRVRILQLSVLACSALPLAALAARAASEGLGANPIEEVTHTTGRWGLRLLLATLAVTPARRLLGWSWLAPLRRTLGLCAFAYASLHLLTYVAVDQFFDLAAMGEDVLERRYITAGLATYLCLLPLAITSTRGWIRRLGRRWAELHRLVYLAAICGVVHHLWLVKADLLPPLVHAGVLSLLLGWRAWPRVRGRQLPSAARS